MILYAGLLACSLILAGLLSGILTWATREIAVSRNWASPPRSKRHIHTLPIPRLGGVAIFCTFFGVAIWALGMLRLAAIVNFDLQVGRLIGIAVPATLLFFVGLADDFRPLGARTKFAFQVISAAYLYLSGTRAFEFAMPVHGYNIGPVVSLLATIIWVVGISNAVNIIDGIDGLAAGSALFSIATVFVMALTGDNHVIAVVSITLAGALLGFLRFNFNPATIFLGDCGSLFIGFLLSSLALAGRHTSAPAVVAIAVPVVALGLPITETAVSIARRLLRGTRIFSPDRRHFHHRLLDLGLSQRQAVALLYAFSAACALASIFLMYPDPLTTGFALIMVGGIAIFGIQKLGYAEFGEFGRLARRALEQRRVIANDVEFRCAAEELAGARDLKSIYMILERAAVTAGLSGFYLAIATPLHRIDERSGAPRLLTWTQSRVDTSLAEWTLTIQLVSRNAGQVGLLGIRGAIGKGQMLFDANVILADLQPALAEAIVRVRGTMPGRLAKLTLTDAQQPGPMFASHEIQ